MAKDNPKIEYGSVHLNEEDFEPKNLKIRISMWISGDVLDEYKAAAAKEGMGYQTLMQEVLKGALPTIAEGKKSVIERIEKIERRINRLSALVGLREQKKKRRA